MDYITRGAQLIPHPLQLLPSVGHSIHVPPTHVHETLLSASWLQTELCMPSGLHSCASTRRAGNASGSRRRTSLPWGLGQHRWMMTTAGERTDKPPRVLADECQRTMLGMAHGVLWCCRTIVAQDVLQLYHSLKLCSPGLSLSAFCKGVAEAAWRSSPQQVGIRLRAAYVTLADRRCFALHTNKHEGATGVSGKGRIPTTGLLCCAVACRSPYAPSAQAPFAVLLLSSATASWTCGRACSFLMTWSAQHAVVATVLTTSTAT